METLTKIILVVAIIGGLSQCSAEAIEIGLSAGSVNKIPVAGAYVKKGKYSMDGHMGMEENKKAMSVGFYREVVDFKSLGLQIGVGLSANKTEETKYNLKESRTYQGYDLELNYDLKKFKIRTIVNSNGDVKAGLGFSF